MCNIKQMQAISLAYGYVGHRCNYSLFIYWVGRAWENEKVSLLSAFWRQRHMGPHGEIRHLFMGVAQLAWQNSMQMY